MDLLLKLHPALCFLVSGISTDQPKLFLNLLNICGIQALPNMTFSCTGLSYAFDFITSFPVKCKGRSVSCSQPSLVGYLPALHSLVHTPCSGSDMLCMTDM